MRHQNRIANKFYKLRQDRLNIRRTDDHLIGDAGKFRDTERDRTFRIDKGTELICDLPVFHFYRANLDDPVSHSGKTGCLDIEYHVSAFQVLSLFVLCDLSQIIYQISFHSINNFKWIILIQILDHMIGIGKPLHHTMIGDRNRRVPPVMCSLYQIFCLGNTIHIAHLGMAVKLHAFFRILVFSCYTEIRSFADSGYRTNGQLSIKFINRRNSFDFQKYTLFNLRKQIRELVIAGKHLDHDRVGKVGHGKHDDCLFVPDLTGIKADHLSPESNLTHLSGNRLQLDRHIVKVPSIDYVRVIGALERIIPTHKASLATFEPTGLSCKFLLFRSLRFLLFLFILRT